MLIQFLVQKAGHQEFPKNTCPHYLSIFALEYLGSGTKLHVPKERRKVKSNVSRNFICKNEDCGSVIGVTAH